jgi:isoquinoline 1-oxidoreductase alpha subunit
LKEKPDPTLDEIIEAMNGNICRCGTYPRIMLALSNAAKVMKEGRR